jgi:hypothetical protein
MGFLDRLLGRPPQDQGAPPAQADQRSRAQAYAHATPQDSTTGATAEDRQAIARYRYLLRTAPPEQIEAAHAQAFERLTPSQRQQVLQEMTQTLPAGERPQGADPRQLARAATRAEMQQPGYLQRTFGGRGYVGGGMGGGMGGMGGGMMGAIGGSMLGTIAGVVIGTAVADSLMGGFDGSPEHQDMAADGGDAGGADSAGDASGDAGGDPGSADPGSSDLGGDPGSTGGADLAGDPGLGDAGGDFGGDFGGGDFGGGDFGGGDFF